MAEIKVVEQINASMDLVWSNLGNFAGLKPGSGIESVDYKGEGVGMIRSIHLSIGTVEERLNHYDAEAKNYSYSIINEDCPLPFLNYSATVQLLLWNGLGDLNPKALKSQKLKQWLITCTLTLLKEQG